ncbi:MAG: AAA family ATPase [Gammaproteobacteria bacterium]|nr:AAA family ATPase [Gammaproteobacteria bacterium]
MEQKVISALLNDRSSYDTLQSVISPEDFGDKGEIIFDYIKQFYTNDPDAKSVDTGLLKEHLSYNYPKNADALISVVERLADVSAPNVVKEFIALRKDRAAHELAQALLGKDPKAVESRLEDYNLWKSKSDIDKEEDTEVYNNVRLSDLVERQDTGTRIPLYPKQLNNAVDGGVLPQSHVLIYAPPEVGKSLLAINMACGFINNGFKTLYFSNEDPADQLLWRFHTCLAGKPKLDMIKNIDHYQQKVDDLGMNNLVFISDPAGTITQLEALVQEHKPDCLVVDQIGNFSVKDKEGTQALEHISKQVRRIAKKYNLVAVSVHQGDANAQGKLYLDLGDVYYSNVGVQAAMDVMIGVGATKEMLESGERMLNLTKNKVNGNHDPIECFFNTKISRVM